MEVAIQAGIERGHGCAVMELPDVFSLRISARVKKPSVPAGFTTNLTVHMDAIPDREFSGR